MNMSPIYDAIGVREDDHGLCTNETGLWRTTSVVVQTTHYAAVMTPFLKPLGFQSFLLCRPHRLPMSHTLPYSDLYTCCRIPERTTCECRNARCRARLLRRGCSRPGCKGTASDEHTRHRLSDRRHPTTLLATIRVVVLALAFWLGREVTIPAAIVTRIGFAHTATRRVIVTRIGFAQAAARRAP